MEIQASLGRDCVSGRVEFVYAVACVALKQEQSGITQLERPVAGAHDRQRRLIECKPLIKRSEHLHRSGVTTGEQHAVVGKQSGCMTAARHAQVPKRRGKRLRRRIENFRGASGFTPGDEDGAVVQQRSSMTGARCGHG